MTTTTKTKEQIALKAAEAMKPYLEEMHPAKDEDELGAILAKALAYLTYEDPSSKQRLACCYAASAVFLAKEAK
ncbi:hypothetical protein N9C85_01135 [Synechococcus sp. AH-224-I15]|nr:hypothetical protein [Synechococcus sp. AH-224-I15]